MRIRLPMILCLSLVSTWAFAQGPLPTAKSAAPTTPSPSPTLLKLPPKDLGTKRPASFNAALSRAGLGLLKIDPPPPFIRLTPAAPTNAGASIQQVGPSIYGGPSTRFPDGVFVVEGAAGNSMLPNVEPASFLGFGKRGFLSIAFPAQGGSLYFVDCRATGQLGGPGPAIGFSRTGISMQRLTPDDGHYIYAFRAAGGGVLEEVVTLRFEAGAMFLGCEITKGS